MDKETELLLRLAANHLYLAQFEPLRAVLLTLRAKNPDLARSFLQTIVANSGRFEKVLWSRSCSTSSHLTYLSALELLQFDNACSVWSFDSESLRLRVEFLLYVQILFDGVSDRIKKAPSTSAEKSKGFMHVNNELSRCCLVLGQLLELGVRRLKADVTEDGGSENLGGEDRVSSIVVSIEVSELICLREVVWEYADIFDALCWNVKQQLQGWAVDDSGLALMVHRDEKMSINYLQEEEDAKVMGFILNRVQLSHLDAIKDCVNKSDEEGAINHLRFLHFNYNVEDEDYRYNYAILCTQTVSDGPIETTKTSI